MILVRAPLRISFFGGGSDIASYYKNTSGGKVLSATIDKSLYLGVNTTEHNFIKVVYSEIEIKENIEEIKHNIVRETLKHFNIRDKFEVSTFADVPVKGTGLGSSSSYCVALIHTCLAITGKRMSTHEIAELACHIEINACHEPIGKQDQYAAAFGGFNHFTFNTSGSVDVRKVNVNANTIFELEQSIILCYTGVTRNARDVLTEQEKAMESIEKQRIVDQMVSMVGMGELFLESGEIRKFATLLDHSWNLKQKLSSNISNNFIDDLYRRAKDIGAWGGKILGAGGGGYLMLMADPRDHAVIREILRPLHCYKVKFIDQGTQIVYQNAYNG